MIGVLQGPQPADEAEHFITCNRCGQAFDMRDLEQVIFHELEEHGPEARQ